MQIARCPCCRARISLEYIVQDECSKELMGLMTSLPDMVSRPLTLYLGLFRSEKRDLSNDRALKLAKDAISTCEEQQTLGHALEEAVQAMRVKQDQGVFKPLTNHNYLKRIVETVIEQPIAIKQQLPATQSAHKSPLKQSKSAQTIEFLTHYPAPEGVDEWFVRAFCGSLAEIMLLGVDNVPAADTMDLVVERFIKALWPKRKWQQKHPECGAKKLHAVMIDIAESGKRWPTVRDILPRIYNG